MEINDKIENCNVSESTVESLKSIGINFLEDFNSYTLLDLQSLLNEDCFFDIIPILKKFFT